MKKTLNVNDDLLSTLFKSINDGYTHLYPLAAIWTNKTKVVRDGINQETNRIAAPDKIEVAAGYLVTCNGTPTHEIESVWGTLQNNKFEIKAKNLATGEVETIKLVP